MLWTVRMNGGPCRVNHAAVAIGENIYSFGGYCTGEDYQTFRPIDIHIFNTTCLKWSSALIPCPDNPDACSQIPFQRYGHTVVAYQDRAFLWGGRNDVKACNILYFYDVHERTWSRPQVTGHIPGARDGHSACVIDHYMYIFGGYEEEIERFSQDVHQFNFKTMMWRYIVASGSPPRWRDFHSASAIGSRMYIFGGRGDVHGPYHSQEEIYCNSIAYLETSAMTWVHPRTEGVMPVGRRSHSAFVLNNKLYIFGGYNGINQRHFGDIFCYDPQNSTWAPVKVNGKGPCPRRRQCCCLVNNKLYLFGGTSPSPEYVRHPLLEFYHPQSLDSSDLMDHEDLHVLDFFPSLKMLSMYQVVIYELDQSCLPRDISFQSSSLDDYSSLVCIPTRKRCRFVCFCCRRLEKDKKFCSF